MKSRVQSIVSLAVALLAVACAVRFLWLVHPCETGWETVATNWQRATLGWFGGNSVPINQRKPFDQADFWHKTIDRVFADGRESPEMLIAAALILNEPGYAFADKRLDIYGFDAIEIPMRTVALEQEVNKYELSCRTRCLELAARATQLAFDDKRWWGIRALLLFPELPGHESHKPRANNWEEVLLSASRHDPDNALYDYLAGACLFQKSVKYANPYTSSYKVRINDPELFAEGIKYLERGLRKKVLAVGDDWLPAMEELLSEAGIPSNEAYRIIAGRSVAHRADSLAISFQWWQGVRADFCASTGKFDQAVRASRQVLRLTEQLSQRRDGLSQFSDASRDEWVWANIMRLGQSYPGNIVDSVFKEAKKERQAARTRELIAWGAIRDFYQEPNPIPLTTVCLHSAVGLMPVLFVFLLISALAARLVARFLQWGDDGCDQHFAGVSLTCQVMVWIFCLIATFGAVGAAPADLISHRVQSWCVFIVAGLQQLSTSPGCDDGLRISACLLGTCFRYDRAIRGLFLSCCIDDLSHPRSKRCGRSGKAASRTTVDPQITSTRMGAVAKRCPKD